MQDNPSFWPSRGSSEAFYSWCTLFFAALHYAKNRFKIDPVLAEESCSKVLSGRTVYVSVLVEWLWHENRQVKIDCLILWIKLTMHHGIHGYVWTPFAGASKRMRKERVACNHSSGESECPRASASCSVCVLLPLLLLSGDLAKEVKCRGSSSCHKELPLSYFAC